MLQDVDTFPDKVNGKSACRKQINFMLNSMDESKLTVWNAPQRNKKNPWNRGIGRKARPQVGTSLDAALNDEEAKNRLFIEKNSSTISALNIFTILSFKPYSCK